MSGETKNFGERELAYVTHPVSPEVKAALMAEGLKIVDAVFAGPEDNVIDGAAIAAELAGEPELKKPAAPKKAPAGKQAAKPVGDGGEN